jgi:DNA-binding transcriptional MerR regulator
MSIGEFARQSRLSPKALRLYDGLGLLSPARVDELSGYRYYEHGQLDQARLIATLRHVGVPLATVKQWLALDPAGMAERVTKPVPDAGADALAAQFPDLTLRVEPAHREAYIDLGQAGRPTRRNGSWSTRLYEPGSTSRASIRSNCR